MIIPLVQPMAHSRRRGRKMECYIRNFDDCVNSKRSEFRAKTGGGSDHARCRIARGRSRRVPKGSACCANAASPSRTNGSCAMRPRRQAAVEEVDYRATRRSKNIARTFNVRYSTARFPICSLTNSQIIVPGYNEHDWSMRFSDDRGEFDGAACPALRSFAALLPPFRVRLPRGRRYRALRNG